MKVKKILALVLATILAVGMFSSCKGKESADTNTSSEPEKKAALVMATEATFPPYEYMEGNEVVGVDVDIAKEIAKELGVELKVDSMTFDAVIPAVNSGKADFGAAGMSITEDRLKEVDFSMEYAESVQVIMTTPDSGIESADDLNGKNVGVQLGTVSDIVLSDEYPEINLVRGKKYTDLAMDLANGNIDAIVLDNLPAQAMMENNEGFVILDTPFFSDVYAICVKKGNTELLETINTVLERLISEGKIQEFTSNHLGE